MTLPKTIVVGGLIYKCKYSKEMTSEFSRLAGNCDYKKAQIQVAAKLDKRVEALVIVHEMLHAVFTGAGEDEMACNENLIERVANLLLGTLLDSDDLLAYLDEVRH